MGCCGSKIPSSFNSHLIGCQCPSCNACKQEVPAGDCETITNTSYDPTVSVLSSWVIPICNGSAIVIISPGVLIPVGTYLWHPTYGYFSVEERDTASGKTELINTCLFTENIPGTLVPACTQFILTANPALPGSLIGVFLTSNFTAPAQNGCTSISFTPNSGLGPGVTISIGSATYFLASVFDAGDGGVICNQGGGFLEGTVIVALNPSGNYQYPINVSGFSIISRVSRSESDIRFSNWLSGIGNQHTIQTPLTNVINPFQDRTLLVYAIATASITGVFLSPFAPSMSPVQGSLYLTDTVNPAYQFTDTLNGQFMMDPTLGVAPSIPYKSLGQRRAFSMTIPAGETESFQCNFKVTFSPGVVLYSYQLIGSTLITPDGTSPKMQVSVSYMGVPI